MKDKIIWRDKNTKEILRKVVSIAMILFFLVIIVFGFSYKFLFIFLLVIISLLFIPTQFKRKLSYITKNGIGIGNITYKTNANTLFFRQKPSFLKWEEIKQIEVVTKASLSPKWSELFDYLILKKKGTNKNYECLIYDSKGFIKTIKKFKKSNLFTKDSKYI